MNKVEFWNMDTNVFTEGPPLPGNVHGVDMLRIREDVYLIGGGWTTNVKKLKEDLSGWETLPGTLSFTLAYGHYAVFND